MGRRQVPMKKLAGIILALLILGWVGMAPNASAVKSEVLILKNVNAWNTPTVENILTSMGISYDVMNSTEFKALSLASLQEYRLVIIVSDQDQQFYDDIGSQMEKLTNYVINGGNLEIDAAAWGWHRGSWTTAMPGGTIIVKSYCPADIIVATGEVLEGWYSSHGYLVGFPSGATIITIQNTTKKPSTVTYRLGNGKVFVTGLTLEYYAARNSTWRSFFEDIIRQNLQPVAREEINESSNTITPTLITLNMLYYLRYTRALKEYETLYEQATKIGIDPAIINSSIVANQTASAYYANASKYGDVRANLMRLSIFPYLRKAALAEQEAVDILKNALNEE